MPRHKWGSAHRIRIEELVSYDEFMLGSPSIEDRELAPLAPEEVLLHDRSAMRYRTPVVQDVRTPITIYSGQQEDYTLNSSSESVLTPGAEIGLWDYVSDGSAVLRMSGPNYSIVRSAAVAAHNHDNYEFSEFSTGTLAKHISDNIDTLLSGKLISTAEIFSIKDRATLSFTRNPSFWLGADALTCESACNSRMSDLECGGTLVAPDIVLLASHFNSPTSSIAPFLIGTTKMYFVDASSVLHERTVIGCIDLYGTDIMVARLNSPLPASVIPAKILPFPCPQLAAPTELNHATQGRYPLPMVKFNQWKQVTVRETRQLGGPYPDSQYQTVGMTYVNSSAQRNVFFQLAVGGDSGSGMYLMINGEAVTVTGFWTADGGCIRGRSFNLINNAITSLGGSSPAQLIDLSAYPSY